MKILCIVGARPNFMKIAPLMRELKKHSEIETILIHTGQHYDTAMSELFFDELEIPKPDINLGVGSASHAIQTSEIMKRFEPILLKETPDAVIVVGDVNSTIACTLVASKINYEVEGECVSLTKGNKNIRPLIIHVEAGLRSFDRSMPEEVNRILTDHISDLLFVTEESAIKNLREEGIPDDKVYMVGNTMIDTLLSLRKKAMSSSILQHLSLNSKPMNKSVIVQQKKSNEVIPYALLTLHRPSNVDSKRNFANIIQALKEISNDCPVVFPAHPRTQSKIKSHGFQNHFILVEPNNFEPKRLIRSNKITMVNPLGYLDFMCLMSNAKVVLTDSGGIQEETTCLGIPCITIRENTERPVTITNGTNLLAGIEKGTIMEAYMQQIKRECKSSIPMYWDGKTSTRIVSIILEKLREKNATTSP